ncbi:MHYT domain-containing protein, partial [Promicromonospora sukumoe]|uniref:MHYT domain-containing protein n=1 Tax=Promicromonospora sukumoe TaxID=88382 RepID=UPI0037C77966
MWLVLGAIALGGLGVWVPHFIAMLGFSVSGVTIRYDVPEIALTAVADIVVVWAGLFVIELGKRKLPAVLIGGALTGSGLATVHYMGMEAAKMSAQTVYAPSYISASVAMAVVAATLMLWCTVRVRGALATIIASLATGLLIAAKHYAGMIGLTIIDPVNVIPPGISGMQLLVPVVMTVSVVCFLLILAIGLWPTEDELQAQAEFENRLQAERNKRPNGATPQGSSPTYRTLLENSHER